MSSLIDPEHISLPISNEANKALEEEIHQKQKEIGSLKQQISDHSDRIKVLTDHLKNVKQEFTLTQARLHPINN